MLAIKKEHLQINKRVLININLLKKLLKKKKIYETYQINALIYYIRSIFFVVFHKYQI